MLVLLLRSSLRVELIWVFYSVLRLGQGGPYAKLGRDVILSAGLCPHSRVARRRWRQESMSVTRRHTEVVDSAATTAKDREEGGDGGR